MLLQDKRIYVVEDNVANRIIFQLTLAKHGAYVHTERWGEEALKRLKSFQNIHLIILDLMLRGDISGYDIFDALHTRPEFADIPIVAVSASEPSVAIPLTQQKGFSGFIAKPIDSDLFPQQIARLIAGEQVWYAGESFVT